MVKIPMVVGYALFIRSGTGKKLKSVLKVGDVNRMVYTCYF